MAKIETSDVDALIEVTEYMKNFADIQVIPDDKAKFNTLAQHVRKVYILLLNASERGQLELKRLCNTGIPDDEPATAAIKALCPDIGQKT
jgi:hypothetical protein